MIIDSKVSRVAGRGSLHRWRERGEPSPSPLYFSFREVWPKFIASGIRASRKIVHSRRNMGNIADSAEGLGRVGFRGEGSRCVTADHLIGRDQRWLSSDKGFCWTVRGKFCQECCCKEQWPWLPRYDQIDHIPPHLSDKLSGKI